MTPDIVGYFKCRLGYAELSKGSGLEPGTTIWGVTFSHESNKSKSTCRDTRVEAEALIEEAS